MLSFKDQFARKAVHDARGNLVGDVNDMAFAFGDARPAVCAVAVHMPWTDQVGPYRLIRPVDDIVLLVPWAQVRSFDEEGLVLASAGAQLEVVSAEGLLLIRQDVIDKQIVDDEGNRLQRVDDVLLSEEKATLRVDMLYLGMTWLPTSVHLKEVLQRLTRQAKATEEVDEIPWELVDDVDREGDILTLKSLD